MKTKAVIEGTWRVERPSVSMAGAPPLLGVPGGPPGVYARPPDPLHAAAMGLVGTLTIAGQTYAFRRVIAAPSWPEEAPRAAFEAPASGRIRIDYEHGATAESDISQLARPPQDPQYAQQVQVARLTFLDSALSARMFRVAVDLDGTGARFIPDFHVHPSMWAYEVSRQL
jgi:hypothetical protein